MTAKGSVSHYDDIGQEYVNNQRNFFTDKEDWTRKKLRSELVKFTKKKILDIGCGAGDDLKWCEEQHIDGFGIDTSEKMLELARSTVKNPQCIQQGDYEAIPYPSEHFDLVMGRFSLHYLNSFRQAYLETARVLKKGGTLILIVSHPFFDTYISTESGEKEIISVPLYEGKVVVKFPPHKLADYFSSTFLSLFDLQEVVESESVDAVNPRKIPETLYFMAVKR
jgi:ubiquinone/menaquinone biosynthesis C-methylase UbiE